MSASIQFVIPEPCHENWEEMTPNEKGRHCLSCQKTVVDFTLLSDQEVRDYFLHASSGVCGRFTDQQLNRPMQETKKPSSFTWKYVWNMLVSMMLLAGTGARAQVGKVQSKKVSVPAKPQLPELPHITVGITQELPWVNSGDISGLVEDTGKLPISNASIFIKGTNRGVQADSTGSFVIPNLRFTDSLVLTVSAIGYTTREIVIRPGQELQNMRIVLEEGGQLLGDVTVIGYEKISCRELTGMVATVTKVSYNWSLLNMLSFSKTAIRCYPNPAAPGSTLTAEVAIPITGEYRMEVITSDGKIVGVQPLTILYPKQLVAVETGLIWSKGVYWLRITGRNTKKVYQSKIVLR